MTKALYCTADSIGSITGGGAVTKNELQALMSVFDDVTVLSHLELSPEWWRQPETPFLSDYFALQQIKGKRFKHAHFYSGTFTQTVRYLKSRGTKVTYTVPAHDRKVTVEEFALNGLEYPWHHIKDDDLWEIFSEGYRLADVVVAPSKMSMDFLVKSGCKSVRVIPHGCEIPDKVPGYPEMFRVGYLGQVGPDKGIRYLIAAWSELNYPDAELWLAGSGTEQLQPYIQQVAQNGRYNLMGRVANIAELYGNVSIYCQPSVCEGFGIEVLESMSYGRPVVVSKGAGAADIVESPYGEVVPIRNPHALAEAIETYHSHKDAIPQLGDIARDAARNHTWEGVRKQYAELFASLQTGR